MKAQFEKIPSLKDGSFNAFIYADDDFNAPWHFHPEYELTYIIEGEGTRHVGNSIEQFTKGDFVLLGSNLPHYWKNSPHYDGGAKSLVLQWNADLLGEDWLDKKEFLKIRKLLQTASYGIKINENFEKDFFNNLIKILKKSPLQRLLSLLSLLESLSSVINYETLSTLDLTTNLNLETSNRIDKIYDYVHNNYERKIRLEEVSAIAVMSNEAFCRFFKKSLNKSFFTFVNEYRINIACTKLIETNEQVGQIAYACGYDSLPFFYRQFKKFKNCSPLSFRKSFRKVSAQS